LHDDDANECGEAGRFPEPAGPLQAIPELRAGGDSTEPLPMGTPGAALTALSMCSVWFLK